MVNKMQFQILVLIRFIYECDFALDFGFYESGYRTKPALGAARIS